MSRQRFDLGFPLCAGEDLDPEPGSGDEPIKVDLTISKRDLYSAIEEMERGQYSIEEFVKERAVFDTDLYVID